MLGFRFLLPTERWRLLSGTCSTFFSGCSHSLCRREPDVLVIRKKTQKPLCVHVVIKREHKRLRNALMPLNVLTKIVKHLCVCVCISSSPCTQSGAVAPTGNIFGPKYENRSTKRPETQHWAYRRPQKHTSWVWSGSADRGRFCPSICLKVNMKSCCQCSSLPVTCLLAACHTQVHFCTLTWTFWSFFISVFFFPFIVVGTSTTHISAGNLKTSHCT